MALSIVIATRDRPASLRRCLASLMADDVVTAAAEIIVVDSASVDTAAVAAAVAEIELPAGVTLRLIRADRPGTSLARNLGRRVAANDEVAFLDDDLEVLPGWAAALTEAFATGADLVTGWIGVPSRQVGVAEPNPLVVHPRGFAIDRSTRGLVGAGANLGVRRRALTAVGGFDERLGPGTWTAAGEDHELIDRLLAAGFSGRYSADARVEHDQWRTGRARLAEHWRMGKGAGARLALLARRDRARLRPVARELIVDDIVRSIARSIRSGYQTGTVYALLRLAGLVTGLAAWLPRSAAALSRRG